MKFNELIEEGKTNSVDELISLFNQVLSSNQSNITHLMHGYNELKKRIDTIEEKLTSDPIIGSLDGWETIDKDVPLTVIFPNGDIIAEQHGIKTFIRTIERIGIEKVKELEIMARVYDKIPIIAEYRPHNYPVAFQEKVGQYYIWKNSQTSQKKKWLEQISDRLNLDLKIDVNIRQRHPLLR